MDRPIPVTVVIPVKNEAENITRCIERCRRFQKIYVVDSCSEDGTRETAEQCGATVVDFDWNGKLPKKRNWFLANHELDTEWVLFLDGDELISEAFCDEVESTIRTTSHVGFWLNFNNWFLGRQLKHGDPFRKVALFKPSAGRYEEVEADAYSSFDMECHVHPVLDGSVGMIRARIEHDDRRGLESYIAKHNEYSSWERDRYLELINDPEAWAAQTPRQLAKYRRLEKWWLPLAYFVMSYIVKRGFLDGRAGWTLAHMKAQYYWQIKLKIKEARRTRSGGA